MNVEQILDAFNVDKIKKVEYFRVKCPFHQDTNPSADIHHKSGVFHCFVCNKKTSLVLYLVKYSNLPIYQVKVKMGYKSDCKNPIPSSDIEKYHAAIWDHPLFLKELKNRCISDDTIRRRRLGVIDFGTEKRITIPILNEIGEYGNVRCYIPGAKDRKFLNFSGKDRSKVRLYPIEQLEFDQILICGGELKALAAAEILNQYDIGAIAPTCGENVWPSELTDRFAGKLVYVNCDIDKTGKIYSELRCRMLKSVAREVHKIEFTPEQVGNLETGDLNDFLRLGGDLYKLLLETPEWIMVPGGETIDEPPLDTSFRSAFSPDSVGKRVRFTGIVSAVNGNDYFVPSVVEVNCQRNEQFCMICDVNSQAFSNNTEMKIGKEHQAILALMGEKSTDHTKVYKDCFRIPTACKQCTFKRVKEHSVTEIRLEEQVEPTSRLDPLTMKVGYIVDSPQAVDSQSYVLTGRLYPSPKNQLSSFIASEIVPTSDALDSYTPINEEELEIFTPKEWTTESIGEKLNEIYSDFEANLTKIYFRRDYHLACDLVYHSVLHFDVFGQKDINSYLEALIIGDTGQGKSWVFDNVMKHYGLGIKVDCKSVTLPGLTIGLEKSHSKFFATYGIMPKNDKKLVIFEELKGMNPKVFQALTEVRSSGMVQITKIEHKSKRARVRILAISNPPEARDVSSYTFGIDAALAIIGTHEDLRRFDFVQVLGKSDIDQEKLEEKLKNPPKVLHRFTDEICQRLVLRAWKCEKVSFEDTNFIVDCSSKLVSLFGEGLPVLDANSSHIKVAKMAAALAARTNSYDGETLIVRNCHVEFIREFLIRTYTSKSSRLDEKSRAIKESTMLKDKQGLIEYLRSISNAASIMTKIAEADIITSIFVRDLCGDFYLGSTLFSRLIRSNAITNIKRDRYAKTTEFTKLLKTLQLEIKKPGYIQKEENKEDF